MINKETYKRLTRYNGKVMQEDCRNCNYAYNNVCNYKDKENKIIYDIDEDCKKVMLNRLAELEDKIMDGTLVEQNEWISVKEKLPNYDEKVLVYVPKLDGCRQNGIFTANYKPTKAGDGSGNFWGVATEACEWTVWSWSYFEHPVVTHWIPLPIPPTEAEAEAKPKELQENKK